ncbi:hypothetical protein BN874_2800001 [Candidatus Contendobacter odensis Run_B_J11]|uniref:Uncharacterized protein n=1 Tax=Candidatus Contendobacter odensis Run_B_J11 TaxID=1400861 RepID=A0A7U7GDC4_9GAMM|nr:hypothetical protein BN874_2800001 [Candidatus Contendobacter odensis Run_B_J11]
MVKHRGGLYPSRLYLISFRSQYRPYDSECISINGEAKHESDAALLITFKAFSCDFSTKFFNLIFCTFNPNIWRRIACLPEVNFFSVDFLFHKEPLFFK